MKRREALLGIGGFVGLVAMASLAVKVGVESYDKQRKRAIEEEYANKRVGTEAVDKHLQDILSPQLDMLLENLGQLDKKQNGIINLTKNGVVIRFSDSGKQVEIYKRANDINGHLRDTVITASYKPHTNELAAVSTSTAIREGIPPDTIQVSTTAHTLEVDRKNNQGQLVMTENDARQVVKTDATVESSALGHVELGRFDNAFVDAFNFIFSEKEEHPDSVDAKLQEWYKKLTKFTNNANRKVEREEGINDGFSIKADDKRKNMSYTIHFVVNGDKIIIGEIRSIDHATLKHQKYLFYQIRDNGVTVRRGYGMNEIQEELFFHTPSSVSGSKVLLDTQFDAWSAEIDEILTAADAVQ